MTFLDAETEITSLILNAEISSNGSEKIWKTVHHEIIDVLRELEMSIQNELSRGTGYESMESVDY